MGDDPDLPDFRTISTDWFAMEKPRGPLVHVHGHALAGVAVVAVVFGTMGLRDFC